MLRKALVSILASLGLGVLKGRKAESSAVEALGDPEDGRMHGTDETTPSILDHGGVGGCRSVRWRTSPPVEAIATVAHSSLSRTANARHSSFAFKAVDIVGPSPFMLHAPVYRGK